MILIDFLENKVAKYLPKSVELLKSLEPFDFGPRPDDIKGLTSQFAIEIEDPDGEFFYYGEVLCTDNDVFCGKGVRVWIKGGSMAILIGWFRNNVFTGLGRNIFETNLQYYDGEFFKFKYHGKGSINYGDRRVYTGDFVNGEEHGYGVCRFANGQIYTGYWKDGKMDGEGKMEFKIEQYTRVGTWKVGQFDGEHTVTYTNGDVRKQFWLDFELIYDDILK